MSEREHLAKIRQEREEQAAPPVVQKPARFRLIPFSDIRPSLERDYLVKDTLPRTGLAVAWGPPKCGKSFWALDIALHIALGWHYRGRRVTQQPVVYLPLEGAEGFRKRIEAFRRYNTARLVGKAVPFYIVPTTLNLIAEQERLVDDIADVLDVTPPGLIVIDTLNRSLLGDENSAEDMARYVRAADALRTAFGCLVLVIHHCGVNGERPRGSTALTAAADAQIAVTRSDDGTITSRVEFAKDYEAGAEIGSKLEVVDLGKDADGDVVRSCVVVEAEAVTAAAEAPKVRGQNALALSSLKQAVGSDGQMPPLNVPPSVRAVSVDRWRVEFYHRVPWGEGITQDAKRKAFKRSMTDLIAAEHVACMNDWVWPC